MYELTDTQTKAVAGGMLPRPGSSTLSPTTRYYEKNGSLYAVTTYPQLTQDKIKGHALGDAVGDALSGGGSAFWSLIGGTADVVGAASTPITGTVSVGPLTQVRSDGYDTESGAKVK